MIRLVMAVAIGLWSMTIFGAWVRSESLPHVTRFDPVAAVRELHDREVQLQRDSVAYYQGRTPLAVVQLEGHEVIALRDALRPAFAPPTP